MKISASKKTIILVVTLFILLIILALGFFFRDILSDGIKYGRWFKVDKYEELFDGCEYTRSGQEIVLKCTGLLESMSVYAGNDRGICYQYRLVPKGDGNIVKKEICEDSKKISLDNPYKELKKILPVSINIYFQKESFGHYKFQKISMVALSDEEIGTMFEAGKLGTPSTGAVLMDQLYGPYTDYLRYRGVCCDGEHYLLPAHGVYMMSLFRVRIEKTYTDDKYMYFVLNGHINGYQKEYTITVKSKAVVVANLDGSSKYITRDNQEGNLPTNIFDAQLVYAISGFDIPMEEYKKDCILRLQELDVEQRSLCENLSSFSEATLKEKITSDRFAELILSKNDLDVLFNDIILNYIFITE